MRSAGARLNKVRERYGKEAVTRDFRYHRGSDNHAVASELYRFKDKTGELAKEPVLPLGFHAHSE